MNNVIEIKAMSKEQAITRALKRMEATPEQIVKVVEKQKSRSFIFGLFEKEGVYEIEISKEVVKKEEEKVQHTQGEEKREVPKKKEVVEAKAKELLEYIGLNLRVDVNKIHERTYLVNLYGEDNGIIIGKKGKTLNSFEYLLNSLLKDYRIEVDVEGFKEKRNETLRELGKKMAEKALKSNKAVRLNPMPPRERKVIHEIVNKYPELDTFSEGRDPKRYIVIKRKK